jgi:hypothetical protein
MKISGDTTYHEDYRKWEAAKAQAIRNDNQYQPSNAPFDGLSTYKGHYIPHEGGPAQSFKPDGNAYRSDAPFDGSTLYRTEYTAKELEPCPATLLETNRSGYVYNEEDEKGHKFYTPKSILAQ